jgi:hypothetical protein
MIDRGYYDIWKILKKMWPKFMKFMDAGNPILWGVFPYRDKALPGLSPSANLAGVWKSIAQR